MAAPRSPGVLGAKAVSESYRWAVLGSSGVEVATYVAGGVWLGSKLDKRYGTSPGFLLLGAALGTGMAFYRLLRYLRWLDKLDSHDESGEE